MNSQPAWYFFVAGWMAILDGLCRILTLGLWIGPSLQFKFALWHCRLKSDPLGFEEEEEDDNCD